MASRIHEAYDDPLGNLEQMTNLVHLAVTPRALVGSFRYFDPEHQLVKCFPAKLRTLTLIGPTREDPSAALTSAVYRHIEPLIAAARPSCPQLSRIDIHCTAYAVNNESHQWQEKAMKLENLGPVPAWNTTITKLR